MFELGSRAPILGLEFPIELVLMALGRYVGEMNALFVDPLFIASNLLVAVTERVMVGVSEHDGRRW